jgi:MFS family permease
MGTAEGRRRRRLVAAVVSGQTIEYYDFLLYASAAALVFGDAFFPSQNAAASTAAAFATFAVGFVVRPLGAVIFGHLGDRVGRRRTLLLTLLIMGVSTTLIGLLPTYERIGVLAPALLVFLRCLQGISIGGEWAGAAALAIEHAPQERRPLWGSLPQMGSPLGLIASTVALLAVSQLGDAQFRAWGWRLPFLLTAVLMIIGMRARILLDESPAFSEERAPAVLPLAEVVRSTPRALIAGLAAATVTSAGFYLVTTFTISYVVGHLHMSRDVGLYGQLITGGVQLLLVPVVGVVALHRSPQRLAALSAASLALWAFPFYALIDTGVPAAVWTAQAVATLFLTGVWALLPALLAAQFPARVRYTGMSLCVQGASIIGGFGPLVASRLLDLGNNRPWLVAVLLLGVALVSAVGCLACVTHAATITPDTGVPEQRQPSRALNPVMEEGS